jgi:hypothetical protein
MPLLIRNYLMSMVPTMAVDPLVQLILAFTFMGVLYVIMLRNLPWRHHFANDADAVLTGSVFLVLFFGMGLMPRPSDSSARAMSIAMISAFFGAGVMALIIFGIGAIQTRTRRHPDKLRPDARERFFLLVKEASTLHNQDKAQAEAAFNAFFNASGRSKRAELDSSLNEYLAYILNDTDAVSRLSGVCRAPGISDESIEKVLSEPPEKGAHPATRQLLCEEQAKEVASEPVCEEPAEYVQTKEVQIDIPCQEKKIIVI